MRNKADSGYYNHPKRDDIELVTSNLEHVQEDAGRSRHCRAFMGMIDSIGDLWE